MKKEVHEMSTDELKQLLAKREKEQKTEHKKKISNYENKRNDFVVKTANRFLEIQEILKDFKIESMQVGNAMHREMYEVFGKEEKETKQFQLVSDDGNFKLVIQSQEKFSFDETAEVHINTIKQVLEDKFASRNKTMYKILTSLLIKNGKGDWNSNKVLELSNFIDDVKDERFTEAIKGLRHSAHHSGTAKYFNAYEKNQETKAWQNISIQFSTL